MADGPERVSRRRLRGGVPRETPLGHGPRFVTPPRSHPARTATTDEGWWYGCGNLTMQINNPYGAELFQPGKTFYLDFTEAPE
jgi:hypothetical protein